MRREGSVDERPKGDLVVGEVGGGSEERFSGDPTMASSAVGGSPPQVVEDEEDLELTAIPPDRVAQVAPVRCESESL